VKTDIELARECLPYVKANGYEEWLRILAAMRSAGLSCEEADSWSQTQPKYKDGEVQKKWRSLENTKAGLGTLIFLAKQNGFKPSGEYNFSIQNRSLPEIKEKSKRFTVENETANLTDLMELSPINLIDDPANDGRLLLESLYSPEEFLFLGDNYGTTVKQVREWLKEEITKYPFFIPNPFDGKAYESSTGKMSFRCDAAIAAGRFAVCEMDNLPIENQAAFWLKLRTKLPITAISHSGSKSLHALIKVNLSADKAEWERVVKRELFENFLVPFGVDRACSNISRLSRLPGHLRDKGLQRLIYLNPEA